MYTIGLVLWVTYALIIHNAPVAAMNIVGLLLAIVILFMKVRYG